MTRRPHDFYPTPSTEIERLLPHLPLAPSDIIREPCCGDGAIAQPLRSHGYTVLASDIDQGQEYADEYWDATSPLFWSAAERCDWVISNPPFNQAPEIIPLAYENARQGIVMLLRLSYQEPCQNRAQWLAGHAQGLTIAYPPSRLSFTGDGKTDSVATAWFVWERGRKTLPTFLYL